MMNNKIIEFYQQTSLYTDLELYKALIAIKIQKGKILENYLYLFIENSLTVF